MTVYGRTRCYTTVYGSRIAPCTEQRTSVFNHSVFLHDLRIRNPFLTVSHRIRCPCTVFVYDLRISPFFSVNGRLRPCLFDLGFHKRSPIIKQKIKYLFVILYWSSPWSKSIIVNFILPMINSLKSMNKIIL